MAKTETELLQAVLSARQLVSEIDANLSEAKEKKESAETALVEYMDSRELKSFKSSTLRVSVIRKETLYVSLSKENKEEAFRWISEDCGRSDTIRPQIHNKTLSSLIGEMLKEGKAIPPNLFNYFFRPELTIIQAKTP